MPITFLGSGSGRVGGSDDSVGGSVTDNVGCSECGHVFVSAATAPPAP